MGEFLAFLKGKERHESFRTGTVNIQVEEMYDDKRDV